MKKLFLVSTAAAALLTAAPATAQVYFGADPYYGAGVQVGPLGFGLGPAYSYRDPDCRIIRRETVTPGGRVIVRSQQICD